MSKYGNRYILAAAVIFSLAFAWRIVGFAAAPPGVYVDEAALAYSSWSLILTGRDEYRQPFPLYLRSFGSYTPALAVYYLALPIKVLGLGKLSLRLTPALIDSTTAVGLAVLAASVFVRRRQTAFWLAGLLWAISPQTVLLGRGFYESTLSICFTVLALTIIYRVRLQPRIIPLGLFLLALSAYAYHSSRVFIWLIFPILWFIWFPRKFSLWLWLISFQLPLILLIFAAGPAQRATALSWFSDRSPGIWWLPELFSRWLVFFSPRHIFWLGDPDLQRSLPGLAPFYLWLILPYLLGLIRLIHARLSPQFLFILSWLILAPLPAALSRDPASFLRAAIYLPALILLLVAGWLSLPPKLIRLTLVLLIFSQIWLWRGLFVLWPERASDWLAGYQPLFNYLNSQPLPAVIDTSDKPIYILYLFYNRIPPATVQQYFPQGWPDYYRHPKWTPFFTTPRLAFRSVNWQQDVYKSQLIAASALSVSPSQAAEHFLTPEYSYSPDNTAPPLITVWRTHPKAKCASQTHPPPPCFTEAGIL